MSVLEVFGLNLRSLTALRGSQTAVAQDLGINRIQFQRYLRAESFPKPNVLKRICDYFGVDARILTDSLTDEQLQMIESGQHIAHTGSALSPNASAIYEGIRYSVPDFDYFSGTKEFTDGIYEVWRGSNARPDRALHLLIRIQTLNSARVIRGYDPREVMPPHLRRSGPLREFRGLLLRPREGYTMLFFHTPPVRSISLLHIRTTDLEHQSVVATGMQIIARSAQKNSNRITRCMVAKVDGGWNAVMRAARIPSFTPWDEVPENIYQLIRPQDETF